MDELNSYFGSIDITETTLAKDTLVQLMISVFKAE